MSEIVRETSETRVAVRLSAAADSQPAVQIHTTDAFLDHMVRTLARYAGLNLSIAAQGDLRHHLIEDVAITLGLALREELPATCRRYGHAVVPMDEALVDAALDAGGRAFYVGHLPSRLYEHFFRSLSENAGMTLHLRVLRGRDRHHVVEAAFKAFGFALREASAAGEVVFSTKGAVRVERTRER
jgi:imidazoleglycerol-phosphate dehydratase